MKKKLVLSTSIIFIVIAIVFMWFWVVGQTEKEDETVDNTKESSTSAFYLDGKVVEIHEEYLMIEALEGQTVSGEVQIWIGLLSEKEIPELKEGDIVHIPHDGKMTMSLPPQMSAVGKIERIGQD